MLTGGKKNNSGQALLELVIVMAILVLTLIALVSLVIVSLSTVQKSRLRARATDIAQEGLENVRLERDRREQWEDFKAACCPDTSCPGPSCPIEACTDYSGPVGEFTPSATCADNGDAVRVTTRVDWNFGGKPYFVSLETDLATRVGGIIR